MITSMIEGSCRLLFDIKEAKKGMKNAKKEERKKLTDENNVNMFCLRKGATKIASGTISCFSWHSIT
jgi:hypothetical protein